MLTMLTGRHPDYAISRPALAVKCDLNTERPEKCLRPTQLTSEGAWVLWPLSHPAGKMMRSKRNSI